MKIDTKYLVKAGIIAALYAALTIFVAPLAFGEHQVRVSEALNILIYFTPSAIPGLFIGCIISNLYSPFGIIDIIFGSLATLSAGIISSKIKNKFLFPLPSIIINGLVVGYILKVMISLPFLIGMTSVMIGQAISLYALGLPLIYIIEKNEKLKNLLSK